MDHFSIVHREPNILSKDHIKPIELLREHLAKKRFPSLVKKITQEVFKLLIKCSDNRSSITLL